MGTHCLIFLTVGKPRFSAQFPLRRTSGGAGPTRPSKRKRLLASGRYGNGDLMEGRVGNLIGFNLRSSLNHSRQDLCYFWIGSAVVSFRVLCCVPQADSERFCSCRTNER